MLSPVIVALVFSLLRCAAGLEPYRNAHDHKPGGSATQTRGAVGLPEDRFRPHFLEKRPPDTLSASFGPLQQGQAKSRSEADGPLILLAGNIDDEETSLLGTGDPVDDRHGRPGRRGSAEGGGAVDPPRFPQRRAQRVHRPGPIPEQALPHLPKLPRLAHGQSHRFGHRPWPATTAASGTRCTGSPSRSATRANPHFLVFGERLFVYTAPWWSGKTTLRWPNMT